MSAKIQCAVLPNQCLLGVNCFYFPADPETGQKSLFNLNLHLLFFVVTWRKG